MLSHAARYATLADMTFEVRQVNIDKGWRAIPRTFGEMIALLHSEVSEALEAYRDHGLLDITDALDEDAKPEGVGSEMADVLIRLLDMCDQFHIDLAAEYERKIEFNRTRPHRHGGKLL